MHILSFPDVIDVDLVYTSPKAKELYQGSPRQATDASAGTDLRALLDSDEVEIAPGERLAIGTGIRVQPKTSGWAGFLYSRSGLGAKEGIVVAQGVGVIDPDYTGEIIVVLLNTSKQTRRIHIGERIAQLVFQPYARPNLTERSGLETTSRGDGGFGHSGR